MKLFSMIVLNIMGLFFLSGTVLGANWTLMVYMDGDNNLESYGIKDFMELSALGSDENTNVLVQFDRIPDYTDTFGDWTNCQRFYITAGMTPGLKNAVRDWGDGHGGREVNMADPQTLEDFITWGMSNYPADQYAVILWNHGGGWRTIETDDVSQKTVCWDDSSGEDGLNTREIQTALSNLSDNGYNLQLIGFDACYMGSVEVAYELKDFAQAMVASEETESVDGWPYRDILSSLALLPDATPGELGEIIVNAYGTDCGANSYSTLSCIDLTSMDDLTTALDDFTQTLQWYSTGIAVDDILNGVCRCYEDNNLLDLYDFADGFTVDGIDETIQLAAAQLNTVLDNAVTSEFHGLLSPCFHGLSIYFPVNQSNFDTDYNDNIIDFPKDTLWDEFLFWYFDEDTSSVALLLPEDHAVLSPDTLPEFSWTAENPSQYRFKLQFSPTSNFSKSCTRTFPRNRWLTGCSTNTVPPAIWERVWYNLTHYAEVQSIEQLYWKVVSQEKADQGNVSFSNAHVFTIISN